MHAIKFLGAAGMVTGSNYRLTSDSGQQILLDMGMFQGVPQESAWNYQALQFDPRQISHAILTHAHLDHCGRLPVLTKNGFSGQIFMTAATHDLAELSLYDTAKVNADNGAQALFAEGDVKKCVSQMRVVDYHQEFSVGDFKVKFFDAGHLLGSTSVEIVDTKATGPFKKIVFSGDLGNSPQYIIRPTEFLSDADVVVMESTYGDKTHPADNPLKTIAAEINAVEHTGGTLLIPAFALERTQDILLMLGELLKTGMISRKTSYFLDSPMAIRATQVYREHPELFNTQTQEQFKHEDPFTFDGLDVVEDFRFSKKIKRIRGPKVIIAGSGMMTGGRILSHAKEFLPFKTTRLLLVGYQGEETLGRDILEGAPSVQIDKKTVPVRATISETESLSSHADQPRLIKWLSHIQGIKKVFLTHGDELPRQTLSQKIYSDLSLQNITLPKMNEEVALV